MSKNSKFKEFAKENKLPKVDIEDIAPIEQASISDLAPKAAEAKNVLTDKPTSTRMDTSDSLKNKKAAKEGRKLYTVWLREDSIKTLKLDAVKRDTFDYVIAQEIFDNHYGSK
jgi:hypothetical protein